MPQQKILLGRTSPATWVVGGDTQGHHRRVSCHTPSTPPTGWERMLTGADGSMTPLESATTPLGSCWGWRLPWAPGWCPSVPCGTWQGCAPGQCSYAWRRGTRSARIHRSLGSRQSSTSGCLGSTPGWVDLVTSKHVLLINFATECRPSTTHQASRSPNSTTEPQSALVMIGPWGGLAPPRLTNRWR